MAGNAGKRNERIESAKRIQVAAAESNHPDPEQDLSVSDDGVWNRLDGSVSWSVNDERPHDETQLSRNSRFAFPEVLGCSVTLLGGIAGIPGSCWFERHRIVSGTVTDVNASEGEGSCGTHTNHISRRMKRHRQRA